MNVRDLGQLIVAKGFKNLPKVQKIAQSDHTAGCCEKLENFRSHNCLLQVAADSQCSVNQP